MMFLSPAALLIVGSTSRDYHKLRVLEAHGFDFRAFLDDSEGGDGIVNFTVYCNFTRRTEYCGGGTRFSNHVGYLHVLRHIARFLVKGLGEG